MFKKALIVAAVIVAGSATAAENTGVAGGTITFTGTVTDTTCDITTNSGSDFTVDLSPVALKDLTATTGVVTSSAKDFTMNLKNCSAASDDAETLKITFDSSNLSDDKNYLKNYSEGGAEGVGIALTSDGSSVVPFEKAFDTHLTSEDVASADGITLTMYANYYNFGGSNVTTGKVVTDATYSFSYD